VVGTEGDTKSRKDDTLSTVSLGLTNRKGNQLIRVTTQLRNVLVNRVEKMIDCQRWCTLSRASGWCGLLNEQTQRLLYQDGRCTLTTR